MLSGGFPLTKQGDEVCCSVQPIVARPFIKLLLLVMCYCVPVLVALGWLQLEVLPAVVTERTLVCNMMGNANVAPAVHETN